MAIRQLKHTPLTVRASANINTAEVMPMGKPYILHESAYRQLRQENKQHWSDLQSNTKAVEGMEPDDIRFFQDALAQGWAPGEGYFLELGCGTGPITRWFSRKGFQVTGVDISTTAIEMARMQSNGLDITYKKADVISGSLGRKKSFHMILDGHCLHCLTDTQDRAKLLQRVRTLLKAEGLFILMSMCGPLNRTDFARYHPNQKLIGRTIYVRCDQAENYDGGRIINGSGYIPTRYIPHWKDLLTELRQASLFPLLIRHQPARADNLGSLHVACSPI
jgi:SAM-dependent methyltransferase